MAAFAEEPIVEQKPYLPKPFVTDDAPKFDLETYISNYQGQTRLNRLLSIGESSKRLSREALRLGVKEAKSSKNVARYLEMVEALHALHPDDNLGVVDEGWLEQKKREVSSETDRLEQELKGYRNNLIKESIRMGTEELGAFYYDIGDLSSAFKAYARMRDYCTTSKHMAEMSLKLMLVAFAQDNWMQVQSHVYKIQGLVTLKPEEKSKVEPIVQPCLGLASLATGHYQNAANYFISTDPSFLSLEPTANIKPNREILTGNDIAVYGALCALASMDRAQLQTKVLESPAFRNFLELEPHLRRALASFCSSKYTQCLQILENYKTDYLLDIYLQRHVQFIFSAIRRKSIVAYFRPFNCVSLRVIADEFKLDMPVMEAELVDMIKEGLLSARLDKAAGVLLATSEDKRRAVLEQALQSTAQQERALRLRLFRINMQSHRMTVKAQDGKATSKRANLEI